MPIQDLYRVPSRTKIAPARKPNPKAIQQRPVRTYLHLDTFVARCFASSSLFVYEVGSDSGAHGCCFVVTGLSADRGRGALTAPAAILAILAILAVPFADG